MSNVSWSSKTGYNGSNKALFEAISKLDKLDSQKGCGQSLYCYELYQNLKKTKEILLFSTLFEEINWKN